MAILTLADLEATIQQTVIGEQEELNAQSAIDDASAIVNAYCERVADPWDDSTAPLAAVVVAKRLASRLYLNPQQRTSYSGPEGLTFTGTPVRLLTDDEREALDRLRASRRRVGSVRLAGPAWDTPA
jgi:hypothetical protein